VSVSGRRTRHRRPRFDWFAGFADGARAGAAVQAAQREAHEEQPDEDFGFTPADEEALGGRWNWILEVVGPGIASAPMVDDDLAGVADWGFDPADIAMPVLIVHGTADRVVPSTHAEWLAERIPGAELPRGVTATSPCSTSAPTCCAGSPPPGERPPASGSGSDARRRSS
jgi:pimeloyl-ACP methyl ester carboxylesterase